MNSQLSSINGSFGALWDVLKMSDGAIFHFHEQIIALYRENLAALNSSCLAALALSYARFRLYLCSGTQSKNNTDHPHSEHEGAYHPTVAGLHILVSFVEFAQRMQADSPAVFKLIEPIEADSRSRRDHRKIAPTCDQHAKKLESEMKSARTVRSDRWWRCCNQAITPTTWETGLPEEVVGKMAILRQ